MRVRSPHSMRMRRTPLPRDRRTRPFLCGSAQGCTRRIASIVSGGTFLFAAMLTLSIADLPGKAQEVSKVEPGHFDYYLLNLSWSPEFCSLHDTNPQCSTRPGFIVHGLWPENNDGTWPAFCADRQGPLHPEENLDITPDATLLAHEWAKHGTCTTLSPEEFFAMERRAFHSVVVPKLFAHLDHEVLLKPEAITELFATPIPRFHLAASLSAAEIIA